MNLKKFEDLAGKWLRDAVWFESPPFTQYGAGKAAMARYHSEALYKAISDTEDDMGLNDAVEPDGDYCLCDGCGKPIEPTRMFHSDRCVRLYSKAHAKDHGKENEDE